MGGVDNRILSFDRGIEGVLPNQVHQPGLNAIGLPQHSQLIPYDGRVEEKVQQLLSAPSREEQLIQKFGPENVDPDTLTPGLFRSLLKSGTKQLREKAKEQEAFGDAADVLEDLDEASQLLEAYRNALRQA